MQKFFVTLLVSLPLLVSSQYWEAGVFGGISTYSGDLTQFIDLKELHPAAGVLARYNVNQWFSVKANIYHGTISGNDANSRILDKKNRNLSFRSRLLDIGVQGEINLTGYKSGHPSYQSSPYIFFGLSLFRFNPKALYNHQWYALQPLCTEGQGTTKYNDRKKYALTQICIPLGAGYKFAINRYWNVGFELGVRTTFTDYLDDVSKTYVESDILKSTYGELSDLLSNRTGEVLPERMEYTSADERGDPTKNDWYVFTGFTLTYSILPNACYRF
ncbi:MAG TPA: DUF6089 family protein [Bacteroidia bacterium]|nr:outer membrane beta-barrel protein [Sphingobacteriales bacterium]HPD65768.1 DUF6089 family protein [Bacteroidia bacterium]HRS59509.1 DUF6089 family protein [Bacteroidia bacterium]HRU67599.1 DUF6089 family protein [Bacteroidia bacterium]